MESSAILKIISYNLQVSEANSGTNAKNIKILKSGSCRTCQDSRSLENNFRHGMFRRIHEERNS
jgi:hypothetical protein